MKIGLLNSDYEQLKRKNQNLINQINEKDANLKLHKNISQMNEKPMTLQEKKNLGQNIRNLPAQYLRGVWEIVNDGVLNQHKEELEFDIDTLPVKKCRELERHVNALMRKNENKDAKGKAKVLDKKTGKRTDSKIEGDNGNFVSPTLMSSQGRIKQQVLILFFWCFLGKICFF